jgi:hypothetical protein
VTAALKTQPTPTAPAEGDRMPTYDAYAQRTTVEPGTYAYTVVAVSGPRTVRQDGTVAVVAPRTLKYVINEVRESLRPWFASGASISVVDFALDSSHATTANTGRAAARQLPEESL